MLIDRYLVVENWRRLSVVVLIVLVSLVLERVLRLFDVVSMHGGPEGMVWQMAVYLIPHYLGLALPAGFFLSMYLQVSQLSDDNEIDSMMGCGLSPARLAAPFLVSGLLLVAVSVALFGYAQPYGRYAYRAVYFLAVNIPWDARFPEYSFATVGNNAVLTADRVDGGDDGLEGVFVHQRLGDHEVITTAARGKLDFDALGSRFGLSLQDGVQAIVAADGKISFNHFEHLDLSRSFAASLPQFRPRGGDVREYTLDELFAASGSASPPLPRAEIAAELNARLVRSVSLVFLPFLAIPVAVAAKRRRRGANVVFGAAVLLTFHYVLQALEGLADSGRIHVLGLWGASLVFGGLCLGLFWIAQRRPGENPLDHAFGFLDEAAAGARALLPARRRGSP